MVFVELATFSGFRKKNLEDDGQRELEKALEADPLAGDLLVKGGGIRKVRWAPEGEGKSGAFRIIYYFHDTADQIFFVFGFKKNNQENLTNAQKQALAKVVKEALK